MTVDVQPPPLPVILGTTGDNSIVGTNASEAIYGLAGNDVLNGGRGADVLIGGRGNDVLGGHRHSTGIVNGVRIYGNTYNGGTGNDTLNGTRYGDRYQFNPGDGQDTINDHGWHSTDTARADIITFGAGIKPDDISVTRDGVNLILAYGNGTDQITIRKWFAKANRRYTIEWIDFANGTRWSSDELTTKALVQSGRDGDETLTGLDARHYSDTLNGGGGNDTLIGLKGADILNGDEGTDTLLGGRGSDTLNGETGNDILNGGRGSDNLNGGSGNDVLGGHKYSSGIVNGVRIYGNTYNGGTGNDILNGTRLGDRYQLNLGDGQDVINDYGWHSTYTALADIITFGAGIVPDDISVMRDGVNLILAHSNGSDQITINKWFAKAKGNYTIEWIVFANGTRWHGDELTPEYTNGGA